jgi:hypothetical protein
VDGLRRTVRSSVAANMNAKPGSGRGDRLETLYAAMRFVRFWHLADMPVALANVRFWG